MRRAFVVLVAVVATSACKNKGADVKKLAEGDGKPQRVSCALPVDEPILTDVVIPARCDLAVPKTRTIRGKLTIEPGAHLAFAEGVGLHFEEAGTLVARGTAVEPIVFASAASSAKPGDWEGLTFHAASTPGGVPTAIPPLPKPPAPTSASAATTTTTLPGIFSMTHVAVRNAGGHGHYAIDAHGRGSVELDHVTVSATEFALRLAGTPQGDGLVVSRFDGNALEGRVAVIPGVVAALGEGPLAITVLGGPTREDATWPKREYLVIGNLNVGAGYSRKSKLTLLAGTTLRFRSPHGIAVSNAALVAKSVTFAAEDEAKGWQGIGLHFSVKDTDLDGCTIRDVRSATGSMTPRAALMVDDDVGVRIANTTFDKNASAGMEADDCKKFDAPMLGNKSVGQPLCVPNPLMGLMMGSLGALSTGAVGTLGSLGAGTGSAVGSGLDDFGPSVAGPGTGMGYGTGKKLSAPPIKTAQVRETSTTLSGGLPKDVVKRIAIAQTTRVRACYEAGLKKDPTLGGTVSIAYTIDTTGATSSVSASGVADTGVTGCIKAVFETTSFPQPEGGPAKATHTFSLAKD